VSKVLYKRSRWRGGWGGGGLKQIGQAASTCAGQVSNPLPNTEAYFTVRDAQSAACCQRNPLPGGGVGDKGIPPHSSSQSTQPALATQESSLDLSGSLRGEKKGADPQSRAADGVPHSQQEAGKRGIEDFLDALPDFEPLFEEAEGVGAGGVEVGGPHAEPSGKPSGLEGSLEPLPDSESALQEPKVGGLGPGVECRPLEAAGKPDSPGGELREREGARGGLECRNEGQEFQAVGEGRVDRARDPQASTAQGGGGRMREEKVVGSSRTGAGVGLTSHAGLVRAVGPLRKPGQKLEAAPKAAANTPKVSLLARLTWCLALPASPLELDCAFQSPSGQNSKVGAVDGLHLYHARYGICLGASSHPCPVAQLQMCITRIIDAGQGQEGPPRKVEEPNVWAGEAVVCAPPITAIPAGRQTPSPSA